MRNSHTVATPLMLGDEYIRHCYAYTARPGQGKEEDKPEARAVLLGDCSTMKVPKELGRIYLVALPLCVFSHDSYDGLAISISIKPRRMPKS
jgi:hypothetical protein